MQTCLVGDLVDMIIVSSTAATPLAITMVGVTMEATTMVGVVVAADHRIGGTKFNMITVEPDYVLFSVYSYILVHSEPYPPCVYVVSRVWSCDYPLSLTVLWEIFNAEIFEVSYCMWENFGGINISEWVIRTNWSENGKWVFCLPNSKYFFHSKIFLCAVSHW